MDVYAVAAEVVMSIRILRPLSQAAMVETITVLLIDLAKLNGTGVLATGFPSRRG